jgi:hypothetical protein
MAEAWAAGPAPCEIDADSRVGAGGGPAVAQNRAFGSIRGRGAAPRARPAPPRAAVCGAERRYLE